MHTARLLVPVALAATAVTAASLTADSNAPTTDAQPVGVVLNADAPGAIPGQYIVGLDGGTSKAQTARVTARADARFLASRYGGNVGYVYSAALRGFSVQMSESEAERLAADPAVDFVQQSVRVHVDGKQSTPPSWGLNQIDNYPGDGGYTYPNRGAGVTVYNTDTELRIDHKSFGGRAVSGWDFIDSDADVNDCKKRWQIGHGTHTAGTSSSKKFGVAKRVTVVGLKMMDCNGTGPDSAAIAAIDWITANAELPAVANASWGSSDDAPGVVAAIEGSIDAGVVWVASAGNDRTDACSQVPANIPRVVTVGATAKGHSETIYSNYGPCVDIFAPGSGVVSASNADVAGSRSLTGTSMAAPHVTGAAAIYLHRYPDATPQEVHDAIVNGARQGFVKNLTTIVGTPDRFLNVQNMW